MCHAVVERQVVAAELVGLGYSEQHFQDIRALKRYLGSNGVLVRKIFLHPGSCNYGPGESRASCDQPGIGGHCRITGMVNPAMEYPDKPVASFAGMVLTNYFLDPDGPPRTSLHPGIVPTLNRSALVTPFATFRSSSSIHRSYSTFS